MTDTPTALCFECLVKIGDLAQGKHYDDLPLRQIALDHAIKLHNDWPKSEIDPRLIINCSIKFLHFLKNGAEWPEPDAAEPEFETEAEQKAKTDRDPMLEHFRVDGLSEAQFSIVTRFAELAEGICRNMRPNPQRTDALRTLAAAKDMALISLSGALLHEEAAQ